LLTSAIIGALLSYLWVVGYYVSMEKVYPENAFVTVKNVTFDRQNTRLFNVIIECPTSYEAKEPATIKRLLVSTNNGTRIHDVAEVDPALPYKFPKKGESKTFKCTWNWANYTGQTIGIGAVIKDGSRFLSPDVETPLVDLRVTNVCFNPTISATHFNVTVQNFVSSKTCNITVDIEEISVIVEDEVKSDITEAVPSLPYPLDPGESRNFTCTWDWAGYQNMSVTVAVYTSQGYMNYISETTPLPVTLEITDVLFDVTNTTRFNVTVTNNEVSPTYLNVTKISVVVGNQTIQWTVENGTVVAPPLPFTLNKSSSETFVCPWNWTESRDESVTIIVYTLQGFIASHTQVTPPPIILDVAATFDPIDLKQFNITVRNSEFSLMDTDITGVSVTIENEIVANLTDYLDLPIPLNRTQSVNFTCPWNWGEHLGKNVTIVVETEQGYSSYSALTILVALTIVDVTLNPVTTNYFIVTVQNPTLLNFTLTTMKVITDETSLNITDGVTPILPFLLPAGANYTFVCSWDWVHYQGQTVTIEIRTLRGYMASAECVVPTVS
jgi:hypothetical protein